MKYLILLAAARISGLLGRYAYGGEKSGLYLILDKKATVKYPFWHYNKKDALSDVLWLNWYCVAPRLRYYVGGFIVTLGVAILMFAIIWLVFSIGQP